MSRKKKKTETKAEQLKPLDPRIAFFYSLFGGPLGQAYCGQFRRGILLWLAILFIQLTLFSCITTLPIGLPGYILCFLLICLLVPVLWVDAFVLAKRCRANPKKRYQRWWFYWLFFFGVGIANTSAGLAIKALAVESFVIPTGSMAPTLQAGDQILVDKLWFSHKRLKRNHLVVYRSAGPGSPPYIMRVVGLPGDVVEIKEEEVFVNGVKWEDEHANLNGRILMPELTNHGPVQVPLDSFFVLGDNRRNAADSRLNGPVPLSDLIGKANLIYWSRERETFYSRYGLEYTPGPIVWNRIGTVLK